MSDRGTQEKHGLALFCAFMVSWALIRTACHRPEAASTNDPWPFATRSARRFASNEPAPPADGGPSMSAPEPAFKKDAVSLLSRANDGGGGPPALMDGTAAGASGEGASASAGNSAPRPGLGGGPGWQLSSGSGGARPSASTLSPSGAAAGGGNSGSFRGGGVPPVSKDLASAGALPAASGRAASPGAAGAGLSGGALGIGAGVPLIPGSGLKGSAGPPSPARPSASDLSAAAAATSGGGGGLGGGGGGGPGGDAGGGGGGAGGGLGGGPKGEKPKGSAGPPKGGAGGAGGPAGAAAAGGGTGGGPGGSGATGGGTDGGPDPAANDVQAAIGTPQLSSPTASAEAFALHPNQPASVPVSVDNQSGAVQFTAKMAIDADGAGGFGATDLTNIKHGSKGDQTAAHHADGKPLNPMIIPFIVIPPDFGHGVKMGDYVAVTYGGRTSIAVVGDVGPKGVVGEGSPALARPLHIPPDKNNGGVGSGVTYTILPGSRDAAIPTTAAEIDASGRAKFRAKGVTIG